MSKQAILEAVEQAANPLDDAKATIQNAIATAQDNDDQTGDPGAVYEPDVIEALRLIWEHRRPDYFRLRSDIKRANKAILITELDRQVKGTGDGASDEQTLAEAVIERVKDSAELFHDSEGAAYARIAQDGHYENWLLGSKGFNHWCSYKAYAELGSAPSEFTLKTVINALSGVARHEGDEHDVYLRTARGVSLSGSIAYFIDLCDQDWRAIEVNPQGWRIVQHPPVRFRRTDAMAALPDPDPNGSLDPLWPLINIPEDLRPLYLAWLLECWRCDTPFPVLELGGQQGSGKSDTQDRTRALVDPNRVNLRSAPKTVEDMYVGAGNNWLVSFNNLSHLSAAQQDALCTLATGGGFATRTFYTNADETIIECKRPVILNGIATLATAQDLVDRLIRLELPEIPPERRRGAADLSARFQQQQAVIFGGLLNLFVDTLKELPGVDIENPPRMADFARLGEAMMRTQGAAAGDFIALYRTNQAKSIELALEASPVAVAVRAFLRRHPSGYQGPIGEFSKQLEEFREDVSGWPRSPKGMADTLRRHVPGLRIVGVKVWFDPQRHNDGYHVHVTLPNRSNPEFSETASEGSQGSQASRQTGSSDLDRERREPRELEPSKSSKADTGHSRYRYNPPFVDPNDLY